MPTYRCTECQAVVMTTNPAIICPVCGTGDLKPDPDATMNFVLYGKGRDVFQLLEERVKYAREAGK